MALSHFKPELYDLVLIDIKMPRWMALKLYKQIKKLDPDATICFLTASEKYREEPSKEEFVL